MDQQLKQLEDAVLFIVKAICNHPEEVSISFVDKETEEKGEFLLVSIKVAKEDIPICIGVMGATAESIRRLTCLFAHKIGYEKRLFVRVDAPEINKNFVSF